ncbi:DUF6468 domain-containing protein [Brevundimonas sp.]|uniref:DUF6468 domain-containing protein n=1 Tax=Brevundimonas sp. TaxID=1871086 RepID=UPI0027379E37|nr:DUF6468 domain-containing protein [Brevundimonas sp.]MDP3803601.1 DUF6468 domain-containing protein [Brevundimonas sp.]
MTGMILDGVLMLLLVAALGYGVRLEKKLSALRAGQQAFASAVTELNAAAGRAEAALSSLRASGQETDLLHDRIVKAREVKAQLEALIVRGGGDFSLPRSAAGRPTPADPDGVTSERAPALSDSLLAGVSRQPSAPVKGREADTEDRALRMAALAERIQGMAPAARAPAPVAAILGALTASRAANQAAKQSLNQTRRSLDEDLFAA